MQWFWLAPNEQRYNNYVLYEERPLVRIRTRYENLACPQCHKVDDAAALRSGRDPVVLRARTDVVGTSDDIYCVSEAFRELFISHGMSGLDFLDIPGQTKYEVALPTFWATVDTGKTQFQYEDEGEGWAQFCSTCHRPLRGRYLFPSLASLSLPQDPLTIAAPSIALENPRGKVYWVLVSEVVRNILRENRISGASYSKAR